MKQFIKDNLLIFEKGYNTIDDFVLYKSTSDMGEISKKHRDAFYDDKDLNGKSTSHKLRIMFAINQYNEGVHAPGVNGVVMGRGTHSDIVFYEQLGRAMNVKGSNPIVIDLAGNIEFIENLQDRLKDRIRERLESKKTDKDTLSVDMTQYLLNINIFKQED